MDDLVEWLYSLRDSEWPRPEAHFFSPGEEVPTDFSGLDITREANNRRATLAHALGRLEQARGTALESPAVEALRVFAANNYSDRPGYREEWRP